MNTFGAYNREEAWKDQFAKSVAGPEVDATDENEVKTPPSFADLFAESGMIGHEPKEEIETVVKKPKRRVYPTKWEAQLDLHGETTTSYKPLLLRFICDSRTSGFTFVRVSPGVGKHSENGPKLRPEVVKYLAKLVENSTIKDFRTAKPRDGGYGALYVYLR
jgi:DNA-nicking Smr family endonuclease